MSSNNFLTSTKASFILPIVNNVFMESNVPYIDIK